jgi:hypothetical protein
VTETGKHAASSGWWRRTSTAPTSSVSSVTSAPQSVALGFLDDHLNHCVSTLPVPVARTPSKG